MKNSSLVYLFFIICFACHENGKASELVSIPLEQMVACSESVVIGTFVGAKKSQKTIGMNLMVLNPMKDIKGSLGGGEIKFSELSTYNFYPAQELGNKLLIFSYKDTDGYYSIFGAGNGILRFVDSKTVQTKFIADQPGQQSLAVFLSKINKYTSSKCLKKKYYSAVFLAPAEGATLTANTTIEVRPSNVAKTTQVRFYAGSLLISTRTAAPWSVTWNLDNVSSGPYTLSAIVTTVWGDTYDITRTVTVQKAVTDPLTVPSN